MRNEESLIQQQCVAWFRIKYPAFATLLFHVPNEGSTSKKSIGSIRKAEGLMAGAPDLILGIMSYYKEGYTSLGIEMKTAKGRQSPSQKRFQSYFEAAGNYYCVVRSFDDFVKIVTKWMEEVPPVQWQKIQDVYKKQQEDDLQLQRAKLQRLTRK